MPQDSRFRGGEGFGTGRGLQLTFLDPPISKYAILTAKQPSPHAHPHQHFRRLGSSAIGARHGLPN